MSKKWIWKLKYLGAFQIYLTDDRKPRRWHFTIKTEIWPHIFEFTWKIDLHFVLFSLTDFPIQRRKRTWNCENGRHYAQHTEMVYTYRTLLSIANLFDFGVIHVCPICLQCHSSNEFVCKMKSFRYNLFRLEQKKRSMAHKNRKWGRRAKMKYIRYDLNVAVGYLDLFSLFNSEINN